MSINIGENSTRFVRVKRPVLDFKFSEKAILAKLVIADKTNEPMTDKETGEVITDSDGNPRMKYAYTEWDAAFWGNAFEAAKSLDGETIDITSGNITKNKDEKSGKEYVRINVFDFVLSPEKENAEESGEAAAEG